MERSASVKQPSPPAPPPQQLSAQDWDSLLDDFQSGSPVRRARWLDLPVLDLAVAALHRRDLAVNLKIHLLLLLEDVSPMLLPSASSLSSLIDSTRSIFSDPSPQSQTLKDQAMLSTTSILISVFPFSLPLHSEHATLISSLTELLLSVANRPNHSPDRTSRIAACECLRELERACPRLLSDVAGHVFSLANSERTHAFQSYTLLLALVFKNLIQYGIPASISSIMSTAVPMVPFSVPSCLLSPPDPSAAEREPSETNLRGLRRVVAFLLERPQGLTPSGNMELVSLLASISGALEHRVPAVAALLKVQFSGLIHSYDPILIHVVLMLYSRFSDAFTADDERDIARRLALVSREAQLPLVFRLLSLHWLLGSARIAPLTPLAFEFYPSVFDPMALKAKKLDVLACIAASFDAVGGEEKKTEGSEGKEAPVEKLFRDGLVCVSAFKWLPPWSSETLVAFRTLHKFLIGIAPHQKNGSNNNYGFGALVDSNIFATLKSMLVNLAMEHHCLVPVIATFVDRLLACSIHRQVGERLLHTFDEDLLPKLETNYRLVSYFPLFERIAQTDAIPPRGLLDLLMRHIVFLTEKHGPDTGLRSWSQGSKVLGICRIMLRHHHSSRVFLALSRLLAFTCQYFPDLEVRDNARSYLRMLLCIPGKKLRDVLRLGEELPGVSASQNPSSFFQVPSPRAPQDPKKSRGLSSYVHLKRVIPLLVKQAWSLALPSLGIAYGESSYEGIRDVDMAPAAELETIEAGRESEVIVERINSASEPLRVMDSKNAGILPVLRRHFACIPDYHNMSGIKVQIPCTLRFESEAFVRIWGGDITALSSDDVDELPALYATTLTFSSTSKFGSILPCHVPFLLGEPPKTKLEILPVTSGSEEDSSFLAYVTIELEPREPMPGLIDVFIKANIENGQIISGSLQSITVGIEDMFLNPGLPADVTEDEASSYYFELFHALWQACGNAGNTGRETFPLSGGKRAAAVSGTQSVKLLELDFHSIVNAVEQCLTPFVVGVVGAPLVRLLKDRGVIRDFVWKEDLENSATCDSDALVTVSENLPLQLQYGQDGNDEDIGNIGRRNMGMIFVMIFLPPRFHLLFQMEVSHASTLVRIRTDHWPCLAYVDEYLESLFLR